MKILHIIPSLEIGGAERLTFDICNELFSRKNVEVELIIFNTTNDFGERPFITTVPSSVQLSIYKKNQLRVHALQEKIESFKPDIIHSHLFLAEIVSRSCTYPKASWFSHFHDNMPQLDEFSMFKLKSKSQITNFYEKQYLFDRYRKNGGNSFIAISHDAETYAKKILSEDATIYYLKNAINYESFYCPIRKIPQNGPIRLINVGSFQKKKNQIFLIEVVQLLLKANVDCTLHYLGDGYEIEKVKQKVKEGGLQEKIFFEGNVHDVCSYLKTSDIYVHSATYEPFGLVLLEAMSAGLPVVCLNGGGNVDILEDGVNGFMLDEADPKEFVNRILKLVNNGETYQSLAEKGQETAKKYSINKYCDNLLALYEKSL